MAASLVGCEPNLLSTAGGQTEKLSTRRLKERHRAWGDLVTGGSNRFEDYPRHSMRPVYYWYIYLHLLDFYGKCRYIYYTLSIWVWKIVPQFFLGSETWEVLRKHTILGYPYFWKHPYIKSLPDFQTDFSNSAKNTPNSNHPSSSNRDHLDIQWTYRFTERRMIGCPFSSYWKMKKKHQTHQMHVCRSGWCLELICRSEPKWQKKPLRPRRLTK